MPLPLLHWLLPVWWTFKHGLAPSTLRSIASLSALPSVYPLLLFALLCMIIACFTCLLLFGLPTVLWPGLDCLIVFVPLPASRLRLFACCFGFVCCGYIKHCTWILMPPQRPYIILRRRRIQQMLRIYRPRSLIRATFSRSTVINWLKLKRLMTTSLSICDRYHRLCPER